MDLSLTGRTAIVTGGSSGIGRAIATELAEAGADVAIADLEEAPRDEGETATTVERVRDSGRRSLFVETDVSEEGDVENLVAVVADELGGIDILVNNAATTQRGGSVDELDQAAWEAVLAVNLGGVYLCAKHAIPALRRSQVARIINIGSTFGLVGYPHRAAYCASKAAVINLTRQLAVDYAEIPILANAVCPGLIQTSRTQATLADDAARARLAEATPLPYFGQPADVAAVAAFLASDAARYITGQCLTVDGGFTAV